MIGGSDTSCCRSLRRARHGAPSLFSCLFGSNTAVVQGSIDMISAVRKGRWPPGLTCDARQRQVGAWYLSYSSPRFRSKNNGVLLRVGWRVFGRLQDISEIVADGDRTESAVSWHRCALIE